MDEPTPSIPWSATLMVTGESRELAMEMLRGLLIAIDIPGANETISLSNPGADGRATITYPIARV